MPKENEQGQEKTERPTQKRLNEARREGNVPRSMEMNSAAVLVAGMSTLLLFGGWLMNRLMTFSTGVFLRLGEVGVDATNFQGYIKGTAFWLLKSLMPFFLVVAVTGILINLIQIGPLFTTKAVQPKLSKLNPLKGLKNLFNQQAFVRLFTNILKVIVIGFVAYRVVKSAFPQFVPLMDASVGAIFLFLVHTILKVAIWVIAILIVIALLDLTYQRWKYIEMLKMSKQEVKEEHKMMEGDPKLKSKIRQVQFQIAFNTMVKELPNADVIVTNPTHVAVALKYDSDNMDAPRVIGKGMRKLAQRIKAIAREHNIPIVENPPLARALFKSCNVGDEIPGQFYQDVAEILAQIYQVKGESTPV